MWIIAALAGLAILLILVLCVPLDLVLHTDVYGKPKFRVKLLWLFGLVSKELTRGKKPEGKKKAVKGKPGLRERWKWTRAIFDILRTKGLLRQIKVLVKDILSCLNIRELVADFRVGLGDPADTGLLFAVLAPAAVFLNSSFPHQIRIQPSFEDDAVFEGYTYGAVRLRPIRLVAPLLKFAFSSAAIRAVKRAVLAKWKRRK